MAARVTLLLLLLALPAPSFAVVPILWTMETFEDFEKGKPEGAAVTAGGELVLAPSLKPVKVPALETASEPFLWSSAIDSKGTLYVGGGNGGKVYRVPRGAQGSLWFETGDLAVHALAIDRADTLYAATSPQGKIYRISGEAKGEVYYQPEDRYTWALAVGPKNELYAGTGERGIIYRIPSRGKAETFFDSEEFHIMSLAVDAAGNVFAGTDGKGLLYRIDPAGKATVLHDSRLREINALALGPKGVVYAAAIGFEGEQPVPPFPQQAAPQPRETPPVSPSQPAITIPGLEPGTSASVTVTATASATVAPSGPPALPKSEVYRIDPDGTVTTLWSSQSDVVYSLTLDASGRPIVGCGEPGQIRSLVGAQQSTILARLPESQVTSLVQGPGQNLFAASSNIGRIYSLDLGTSEAGSYLSPPRDAATTSRWGRISWRASLPPGARVEMQTRSGNSGIPDATWSDWSASYVNPEGSAITSPAARFVQWRARLARSGTGAGPALHAVSLAYLPANLAPTIRSITILPPGIIRERLPYAPEQDPQELAFTGIRVNPEAASAAAAQMPQKKVYVRGMRAMDWEAEDPNGDLLSYDVEFRGEGETAWKPLVRGLRDSYFAFDSTALPDGLYRVRVEVTDALSNPAGQSKDAALGSEPFVIDNTPPAVQVTARRAGKDSPFVVETAATDGLGPIARAEYSVDAARWITIAPTDGVSDSRTEAYAITLPALRPGEHTIIVKVTDLLGNVGAGKATFSTD